MNLNDNNGVISLTKEIETKNKYLTVEVRISEKFGFVNIVITDNATGQSLDLDIQLKEAKDLEAILTSDDKVIGTLTKFGMTKFGMILGEK